MFILSIRTLAALAFERGQEFDPALTLPSAPLTDDLAPDPWCASCRRPSATSAASAGAAAHCRPCAPAARPTT